MKSGQNIPNALAPSEPSVHRLAALDSIRGLAALAVLFGHTGGMFQWPEHWVKWIRWPLLNAAFGDGRSAVTMFFVLSGFVLARPYVSGVCAPLHVPVFYVRRVIRIWLPWFCAFILSLICRGFFFHDYSTDPQIRPLYWQYALSWRDLGLQCGFLYHSSKGQLIPQDWSLGVELIGSALIPVLVVLVRPPRHWLWPAILGIAFLALVPQDQYFNSGSYYVSFIFGALLARHHERLIAWLKKLKFHHRLGLLLIGLALYEARRTADHFGYNGWTADKIAWVICSAGCVCIIAASLSSRRIGAFLTVKPVLWIGRVSYSVYLLQFIVLLCILPAVFAGLNRLGFGPALWMLPFSMMTSLVLTLALAWPFHRFAEVPSIDLGHWVSRKMKNAKWLGQCGVILEKKAIKQS